MSILSLTQKEFSRAAGARAVVWVDPACVHLHSGSKWPVFRKRMQRAGRVVPRALLDLARPALKAREPFFIPADLFQDGQPVAETPKYRKVADFIAHRDTPKDSLWYAQLTDELKATGVARHKAIEMRSEAEILGFLEEYVGGLMDSLREHGFSSDESSYESAALINRDGSLTKTGSGNHRFNMCHALGIAPFPLKIVGAHRDWFTAQDGADGATLETLLSRIQEVGAQHR
ncbi:hypothetical protein SAMN05421759_104223 [Roseivivax lentus]|uniref:Uncharacterized protein n=1 Tax=Roseivivax lentus TaxID=633194 RepID=A0A1N7MDK7_9RHOB|nr:hypothetical protein [Roseivivax lentus]SIS84164.1 hypothetical protein SAMN05421759_104223 [Roseivivax lentus]